MSKLTQNVDYSIPQITRLYGRKRPIHKILGGGEDILLWRNKIISGVTSIVVLTIWFLFEFAEYNLVTFLCHLTITVMLIIFIWTNGAKAFGWTPPNVPKILLEESTIYQGFCVMGTLPYLYEKHEEKVDYLFHKLNQKVFKIYKMFDRYVVSKIPRWPMRSKKSN
ncbi:Reticulon [Cynara cardunculus var. scolymus]|uniref:Reticulon-like protein n=1 Tax=Cynara cardunculus var. scolymus TaxID=59895 RepID=A0A103Y8G4_CYNCS|nr:Reticulon [Cynara cardunculus var. scolymus]